MHVMTHLSGLVPHLEGVVGGAPVPLPVPW